jgi:hypothetical protein
MMGHSHTPRKYGRAAMLAVALCRFGRDNSPEKAWERAVAEVFPDSQSSQEKGCPKNTFLGLCQEGLVKGIGRGEYTNSQLNREYGIKAVGLLQSDPELSGDMDVLWERVMAGEAKLHNSQMDVVLSLWNEGLLTPSATI